MIKNINWFMLPTKIFERAVDFYNVLFDVQLELDKDYNENNMALIKADNKVVGCISGNKKYQPSGQGTIVYIDTGENIDEIINRVIPAGGKIKMPKTKISNIGYIAHIEDSEGNILGLFHKI